MMVRKAATRTLDDPGGSTQGRNGQDKASWKKGPI
eukprot:CAMPEP_0195040058 /NCGR_PEP_ID=MMETSP0326_2-20130528/80134_1 /TAXON_ID=2866 ORGANISM="Crypthecodinium cohnii, Strain Seligo" /NCGR_SAMPLE_ID=MMETSP0326_2 /ASSEMBLY_ACC=CAM_ASM_000348 /LENGTH=34 /DNA_ID= /DNA_START= /DNA_END= /DNA_ORIENTATION=